MQFEFCVEPYELPEIYMDQLPSDVKSVWIDFEITDSVGGNRSGHPDTWTPDEPEDFNFYELSWVDFDGNVGIIEVDNETLLYPLCKKLADYYIEWMNQP